MIMSQDHESVRASQGQTIGSMAGQCVELYNSHVEANPDGPRVAIFVHREKNGDAPVLSLRNMTELSKTNPSVRRQAPAFEYNKCIMVVSVCGFVPDGLPIPPPPGLFVEVTVAALSLPQTKRHESRRHPLHERTVYCFDWRKVSLSV